MKASVYDLVSTALVAALFCILGPLSIPIGPVPLSLTGLALYLSLYIAGCKKTLVAYIVYLLIGIIGLPVFSSFSGGLGKILGPTGGYLAGFVFTAFLSGIVIDRFYKNKLLCIAGMYAGLVVLYAFGTAWFAFINDSQANTVYDILKLCVIPFIPGDSIKIIISAFLGPVLRDRIKKSAL